MVGLSSWLEWPRFDFDGRCRLGRWRLAWLRSLARRLGLRWRRSGASVARLMLRCAALPFLLFPHDSIADVDGLAARAAPAGILRLHFPHVSRSNLRLGAASFEFQPVSLHVPCRTATPRIHYVSAVAPTQCLAEWRHASADAARMCHSVRRSAVRPWRGTCKKYAAVPRSVVSWAAVTCNDWTNGDAWSGTTLAHSAARAPAASRSAAQRLHVRAECADAMRKPPAPPVARGGICTPS